MPSSPKEYEYEEIRQTLVKWMFTDNIDFGDDSSFRVSE